MKPYVPKGAHTFARYVRRPARRVQAGVQMRATLLDTGGPMGVVDIAGYPGIGELKAQGGYLYATGEQLGAVYDWLSAEMGIAGLSKQELAARLAALEDGGPDSEDALKRQARLIH